MNRSEVNLMDTKDNYAANYISYLLKDILGKTSYMKMCIISLGIIIVMIFSGIMIVNAEVSNKYVNTRHKYYTSIDIDSNDTLWSIANKYIDQPEDISSYINEIKNINKMSNYQIYSGQHLIIYYYLPDTE